VEPQGSRLRERLPDLRTAGLAALVLLVLCVSLVTYSGGRLNLSVYRIDLDVYRFGSTAWLHGADLYGALPPAGAGLYLGFTYPPISAVVMAPLAMIPTRLAGVVITVITIGLLMAVMALFLWVAGIADRRRAWRLSAALLPLAVLIEPVRTTLAYGQINVVLMALVAFDCLAPDHPTRRGMARLRIGRATLVWPRGALVGLAAAIKLTPMVFLLYFVARRDRRGAAATVASFLAVTGIGFLVAWRDSIKYWTDMVFDTGRIGPLEFSGNQSITGVFYRAHLTGSAERDLWLASAALVGLLALAAVTRAVRAGRTLLAVALTACTEELVSPVSWSHHWVWAAPVLLTAVLSMYRAGNRRMLAWSCAGVALFVAAPQFWFPHTNGKELRWAWWEQVIGSAYVWVAIAALVVVAYPEIKRLWREYVKHTDAGGSDGGAQEDLSASGPAAASRLSVVTTAANAGS
jgi:alpha-1,2-mannosyltransferase